MKRLLSAECARLFRSRLFWVLEGVLFAGGLLFYGFVLINNIRCVGLSNWLSGNEIPFLLSGVLPVLLPLAICSSLFVAPLHSDGGIRNMLIVGNRRWQIYIAVSLVITLAGYCFALTLMVASIATGVFCTGNPLLNRLSSDWWKLPEAGLILLSYGAAVTLLTVPDRKRTRNAVLCVLLAIVLIALGIIFYSRLQEPELCSRMVMQEDGSFLLEENVPNPNYVGGMSRRILTLLCQILPTANAMSLLDIQAVWNPWTWLYTISLTAILTLAGIGLFHKKDLC